MAGQQATLDISARITGYQASLQQVKKAIDQINPGSMLGKSLQKMFKQAQDYINQLAKKPIVNVGNDAQIHKVNSDLQHAYNLINNIAQGFQNITFDDINVSTLDEATKKLQQLKQQAQDSQKSISEGLKLNKITDQVTGLADVFKSWGQNINELTAGRGFDILQSKIEESRKAGEALTVQLETAKTTVKKLKDEANTGIFGKQVDTNTRARILETIDVKKNPINNVNFDTDSFSKEAVENLKKTLENNLAQAPDALRTAFSKFFDETFSKGITNINLQSSIQELVKKITDQLNSVDGAQSVKISDVFGQLFGANARGNLVSNASQAFNKVAGDMRQITLQTNDAANSLKFVAEILTTIKSITKQKQIKLFEDIDANKLKEVQQVLYEIAKKPYDDLQLEIRTAQTQRNSLAQKVSRNNKQTSELENLSQAFKKTPEWQEAQEKIQALENEVSQLKKQIQQANGAVVKNTKDMVSGAAEAANKFKLTTDEVKKLQTQANQLKEVNSLISKMQGVLTRWFSIYAVVNKVIGAIKSMISTVQQLDKTITNIAIVTDMSQSDLWAAMPTYTKMAREFAASISGVYEVSQLYYQQGKLNI